MGNNTVDGGSESDTLFIFQGNNSIYGGSGDDIFFWASSGEVVTTSRIWDFEGAGVAGGDVVQLDSLYASSLTLSYSGSDALLSLSGGSKLILVGASSFGWGDVQFT